MDTIQPLLTCMVHQESCKILYFHKKIVWRINEWTPFSHSWLVWSIRSLSCEHRMQILWFENADHVFPEYRSCVSTLQIPDLVFPQYRSCVSTIQIWCIRQVRIILSKYGPQLRQVCTIVFSSQVDLRQVYIMRHVGMHSKYI